MTGGIVTVLRMVMVAVPLLSVALGASKVQAVPNCTVLLVLPLQSITGALVSTTVTVWLHWALLLQASIACQVRVASKCCRNDRRYWSPCSEW